jgi:SPP1 gp7 family putative phage head morphogenesis protein
MISTYRSGSSDAPSIVAPSAQLGPTRYAHLPKSEVYARRYYGRNLDLVAIENAILMAQIGIMSAITDLGRETLRNDPSVSGLVYKRLASVASADWTVEPANDSHVAKQIAESFRLALVAFRGFRQFLFDTEWAVFDGRAASEIEWAIDTPVPYRSPGAELGAHCRPKGHIWIHPGRLSFGPQRELRVVERHRQTSLYYQVGDDLNSFTPGKIVQWMPRVFGDYPEREGLLPRVLYWCFFKRFSWRHRMILTELFGIPWRIIETETGTDMPIPDAGALDDAEAAAENLGAETTLALEPGMKLRLESPHPESGTLFGMNSQEINDELAKLILMQPTTQNGDPTRAGGVIAERQEDLPKIMDGTGLSEVITEQLAKPFTETNYGREALVNAPRFKLRTEPARDKKADLERADAAMNLGLELAEAEVYEVAGFRKPKHGEPVLRARPEELGGGAPGEPGAGRGGRGPMGEADPNGPGGTLGDAVSSLLDAFDEDLLAEPDDDEQNIGLVRALEQVKVGKLLQPSSANGSPEAPIDKGVRESVKATTGWAAALASACAGADREVAIHRALTKATAALDVERFARAVERKLVHGLMLGALDAHVEMIGDAPLKPTAFGRLELGAYGGIADFATKPFAEAIKLFGQRKVITKRAFERLAADAKRRAFTVAHLATNEMLNVAHSELASALTEGRDLASFSKDLAARFDAAGWTQLNPSHVETIFRTNVMSAYSDGRHAQMTQPAVLAERPYWQILGVRDDRARPHHAAANGKALLASDPFWSKNRPPWGFNCRCRVVSRGQKDVEKLGLQIVTGADLVGLPDDGWDGR